MVPVSKFTLRIVLSASLAMMGSAFAPAFAQATAPDASPDGLWRGSTQVNGQQVPFTLEVTGTGDQVQGAFINGMQKSGKQKSPSSSGSYADGHLVLHFDYYANTLDATIAGGVLTGTFGNSGRPAQITARLNASTPPASPNPPNIAGTWEVKVDKGPKGEHAWKLEVRQTGANVEAVIQRIDGDTGALYGVWRDGQFAVSHFTAGGPSYQVLKLQKDGTLQLISYGRDGEPTALIAQRPEAARAAGLVAPDDPLTHTKLQNPNAPIAFSFPDLNGKIVSNTDAQFKNKVVIVSIGGSWCPNCQDEAPFLVQLYQKYHDRGLEIVELSFEEAPQLANPTRLRAVIRKFGINYTVLLAGTRDQLNEKIRGVDNLNCWPTTFFVGKDGLVKAIHTGYSGPATGKDNEALEHDNTALVEKLLAARPAGAGKVAGGESYLFRAG